jgi:hypothetical protein
MTTENRRPVSGRSPEGTLGSPVAAVMPSPRQRGHGQVSALRSARAEPSWGRVLLTTVELWLTRRLRHASFVRPRTAGRRSENRPRPRSGRLRLPRLALAVAAAAAVTLVVLQFTGILSKTGPQPVRSPVAAHPAARAASSPLSAAAEAEAVSWIASQVNSAAIIGCYPAMCASLQEQGVSASRLMPLGSGMSGILGANVIVTPAAVDKSQADLYAPALIAGFGSGGSRIEVRGVMPGGAVAYQSALRTDLRARESAGAQLLRNPRVRFSAADASRLAAGTVDSRLLVTLAALSSQFKLRVMTFGDSSPGVPLFYREVAVASDGGGNGAAVLAAARAMVNAQQRPYLPALSAIVRPRAGQSVLLIEFASPSPLGLLTTVLTADTQPEGASHD